MNWRYLGHLQLWSRAKYSLTAMAKKEVCPRDEIADQPGTASIPIDKHAFAEGLVSFRTLVWCVIVADEIFSEPSDCLGPATVAGTVRGSVFLVCVGQH